MNKPHSNFAFVFLAPALLIMALSAALPLAMVVNYSVQDSFAGDRYIWVGARWFGEILSSSEFFGALGRSFSFSMMVLLIEVPIGIYVALKLPPKGLLSNIYIVLIAIPLLTPWLVVGYVWKVMVLPNVGLITNAAAALGVSYDMNNPVIVWATLGLMDAWHWTSLVVLLCFAGLRAIPDAYYQAARIDGASNWAVFRYIQFPKLRLVLLIAVLLRFMDSFIIYTETYVLTRGGPGVSTTFLSHELVQTATIQFDLGEGGAMAVVYFLIVLCVSWAFYSFIVPREQSRPEGIATNSDRSAEK